MTGGRDDACVTAEANHVTDIPDIVYHYTNSRGLLGILSSNEFWLNDVEFMNDSQELVYARSAVIGELRARADGFWSGPEPDPDQSAEWNRAAQIRSMAGFLSGDADGEPFYHVYATCFCEAPDLLSQWRGYAGAGGYAVGIRTSGLIGAIHQLDPAGIEFGRFSSAVYGLDAATSLLTQVIGGTARHPKSHWPTQAWHEFMNEILPLVATIKNPAFREEREWRMILLDWGLSTKVRFRAGHLGLVPYRVVKFPPDAVHGVIVGPGTHPDLRSKAVRQLLERYGYKDVNVRNSTVPFRP